MITRKIRNPNSGRDSNNFSHLLVSLLSVGALTACGGGGGGGGGDSSAQNVRTLQGEIASTGWQTDTAAEVASIPVSMTAELCESGVDETCSAVVVEADSSDLSSSIAATINTATASVPVGCEIYSASKQYGLTSGERIYFSGATYNLAPGWKVIGADPLYPITASQGGPIWIKDSQNSCGGLAPAPIASSKLVELKFAPPVGNQKNAGTCTAWAASVVLSNMANRISNRSSRVEKSKSEYIASPRQLYTQLADPTDPASLNNKKKCWGSSGLNTFMAVYDMQGVGSLKSAPYAPIGDSQNSNDNDCRFAVYEKNAATWNLDKSKFKISGIRKVPLDIAKIKAEIDSGNALFFGAKLNQAFYDLTATKVLKRADFLSAQKANDPHAGGHAMAIVGYDDGIKAFKVQNSWGEGFGEMGYAYIDYELMTDSVNFALEKNLYTVIPPDKTIASNTAKNTLMTAMAQKSIAALYFDPKNAAVITTTASRSDQQISLSVDLSGIAIKNPGNASRSVNGDPLQYTEAELIAAAMQHLSKSN